MIGNSIVRTPAPSRRLVAAAAACSLASGLVLAVAPAASAQTDTQPGAPAGTQVTVLGINDFHGHLEKAVDLAGTVEGLRAQYPGAVFTSAGDNIGGSPFVSAYKQDQPTLEVLNAMGLQTSAVGNHEFDRGVADLQGRVTSAADFPYRGANVTVNGTPLKEYEVVEANGVRVGVIGAVTAETPSLVSPTGIQGVAFSDPVDAVNRVAGQLTDGDPSNGEADVVVASYHDGAAVSSDLAAARAATTGFEKIVGQTSGEVDAIFTGHTHMEYSWTAPKPGGGTRPVLQAGQYGENVGRVTLTVDDGEVTAVDQALHAVEAPADPANSVVESVTAIVDANKAEADVVGAEPVGTVTGDITTAVKTDGGRDDRLSESTLGNLVAQFMVDAVADRGGADIGFMNPGGLRDELLHDPAGTDGNITKAEADAVLPFANTIMTLELTGAQVKKVLEQQWQPEGSSRPFLALGASEDLTWTFDPTRPAGDRITSISLKGAPIDPAATYTVASQSFLAGGGDNFTEFANATNVRDTGMIDSEAWQAHLAAHRAEGLAPDFSRRAVAAKNLPTEVEAGQTVEFTLSDLDLTSRGVPAAKTATVTLGDVELGKVDVTTGPDTVTFGAGAFPTVLDGRVDVTVEIPADAMPGAQVLTVTTDTDTGTVVTVPVTVGAGTGEPAPEQPEQPEGTGSLGSLISIIPPGSAALKPETRVGQLASASLG